VKKVWIFGTLCPQRHEASMASGTSIVSQPSGFGRTGSGYWANYPMTEELLIPIQIRLEEHILCAWYRYSQQALSFIDALSNFIS
jgi:hypothetical protein